MKKLILTLLIASASYSQSINLSAGFDVRNAIIGSEPTNNNPELDLLLSCRMVSNHNVVISVQYETFKAIGFDRYSFGVGYRFTPIEKIYLIPSINADLIGRKWKYNGSESSHLAFSLNNIISYDLNDNFAIGLETNLQNRADLNAKYGETNYVLSNYLTLIYKIPIGQ